MTGKGRGFGQGNTNYPALETDSAGYIPREVNRGQRLNIVIFSRVKVCTRLVTLQYGIFYIKVTRALTIKAFIKVERSHL